MSGKKLWVQQYRPQKLDDYVWSSPAQKSQVETWVKERHLPNLLLTGHPGIGKTALAMMLMNELDVDKSDIKFVNGSTTNGIDFVRDLENFVDTMPFGEFRYVILDESDGLSSAAQAGLRNMIETYSNTARFILTANYSHKIIPALKSRCQTFEIQSLEREQFVERIATVLMNEGIELTVENFEILDDYVSVCYPDLRKCINMLQQNCIEQQLRRPAAGTASGTSDYVVQAVGLFKEGRITEARKLLAPKLQGAEFEETYRLLYQNLNWWGTTDKQQNAAIVIIANRLRDHAMCADPEINLSAALIELANIASEG
jgi:DNA polymerase III delta prime subunit